MLDLVLVLEHEAPDLEPGDLRVHLVDRPGHVHGDVDAVRLGWRCRTPGTASWRSQPAPRARRTTLRIGPDRHRSVRDRTSGSASGPVNVARATATADPVARSTAVWAGGWLFSTRTTTCIAKGRLVGSVGIVAREHRPVGVDALQDGPGDLGQLSGLLRGQGVDDVVANGGDVAGRGVDDLRPARSRSAARWWRDRPPGRGSARRGCGVSRRRTTWERRGSVALVRTASAVIRSVRSGASESIASRKYSKWLRPASRRSCESRTPGSSSTTAISRTQACLLLVVQPTCRHGHILTD